MIQSLKRLVRQMWVGARPAPASEALMMTPEDVATFSAQAKIRRENLKRAMETAFASAPEPVIVDAPVLLLDASVEVAEAAAEAARRERESDNRNVQMSDLAASESTEAAATSSVGEEISILSDQEGGATSAADERVVLLAGPEEAVVEVIEAVVAEEESTELAVDAEPVLVECATPIEAGSDVLSELMPSEAVVEAAPEEAVADLMAEADVVAEDMPVETAPVEEALVEEPVDADLDPSTPLDVVPPAEEVVEEAAIVEVSPEVAAVAPEVEEPLVDLAQPANHEVLEEPLVVAKASRAKKAAPKKKAADAPKKKAAPKKSKSLDDDVWVSDAVAYSLAGSWPEVWVPPVDEAGAARLEEFRTKAAEGVLTIWGRASDSDAWEPIKATYWKSGTVEPMSFVEGREHVATEGKKSKGKASAVYSALKVSKAQVEELWGSATAN